MSRQLWKKKRISGKTGTGSVPEEIDRVDTLPRIYCQAHFNVSHDLKFEMITTKLYNSSTCRATHSHVSILFQNSFNFIVLKKKNMTRSKKSKKNIKVKKFPSFSISVDLCIRVFSLSLSCFAPWVSVDDK